MTSLQPFGPFSSKARSKWQLLHPVPVRRCKHSSLQPSSAYEIHGKRRNCNSREDKG